MKLVKFSIITVFMHLSTLIGGSVAVQNSITIYNSTDQQGANVTFTDKIDDLSPWRSFLDTAQSYCATGV